MMEINFIFTFRLQHTTEMMEINFYISIQITTIQQKRWKSVLYLHLDYDNTTEMINISFIFVFRLQQYHKDNVYQFYISN